MPIWMRICRDFGYKNEALLFGKLGAKQLGPKGGRQPTIVTHPHISSSSTTRDSGRHGPCLNSPLLQP
jgi:hypothetical protein